MYGRLLGKRNGYILRRLFASISAPSSNPPIRNGGDVTQDAAYLAGLVQIMGHIGTKPGVYVMLTTFGHPSMDANELPTAATMPVYQKLSDTFKGMSHVLYSITNEPHGATERYGRP